MLAGLYFRAARARCSRAFFVSAEVGDADAEICPDDPGDERRLVVRAGTGESTASPGPPGTSLICAPARSACLEPVPILPDAHSELPARWGLPILGPQVKPALGKLARDRVALDPPAAAQNNSHRLMQRELVRVAIHRSEPTAGDSPGVMSDAMSSAPYWAASPTCRACGRQSVAGSYLCVRCRPVMARLEIRKNADGRGRSVD